MTPILGIALAVVLPGESVSDFYSRYPTMKAVLPDNFTAGIKIRGVGNPPIEDEKLGMPIRIHWEGYPGKIIKRIYFVARILPTGIIKKDSPG